MSRTVSTTPRAVRAARRVRTPFAPRRDAQRRVPLDAPERRPRVVERAPGPGWWHPAGRADVVRVLRAVGPEATYGLHAVELCRGPSTAGAARVPFGRLLVPGTIRLFAQPAGPWRLPAALPDAAAARFRSAGALVAPGVGGTLVSWPEAALRRFVLLDVLLHELGHHRLQHERGKRPARTARTRDHETAAGVWARRWRPLAADVVG